MPPRVRRPLPTSVTALGLVLVLLGPAGCGDDSQGSSTDSATDSEASTTDASTTGDTDTSGETDTTGSGPTGSALFLEKCSSCHGSNGEGSDLAYEIRHPIRDYSSFVVRNGRPGPEFPGSAMPAFTTEEISDDQLETVWDYLEGYSQPTDGEGLYLDYCRNCHAADGSGGVSGVDIRPEPPAAVIFHVRKGAGGTAYASRSAYMPAFTVDRLSDAELDAVAAYVDTL